MHTNRLIEEKSPYLQQHAHNPVDWYPWGEVAFEKARREDKPIFLSIGYSTCHWCHVMERESFESEEVAQVLNRFFVPVKVDREERPDVDRIYMMFVQATTGGGGWPMSVWLTPDLKPFYGGTYFPPANGYGRPGFTTVLTHIANAWMQDRARITESGNAVLEQLREHAAVVSGAGDWRDSSVFESGFYAFRRSFDPDYGGFGGAPKFPRAAAYNFLLRYYARSGNREALDMVLKTLGEMARGGMHDQLGGGFHRYSVDARWFVPHFEKMLYDQAQLATSYLEAHQITGDPLYAGVARDIFRYVLRDMTHPAGGFYSAEDADSVIDPEQPEVMGEGAFYVWRKANIEKVLGKPAADWFCDRYGVEEEGNVREDPHGEFTGKNILFEAYANENVARRFGAATSEVEAAVAEMKERLLQVRSERIRPHLDDKILTSWNALMISAFALGARVLEEPRYLEAGRRAADFILERMYDRESGILLRRYRDGEAAVPGFLDDYAFFIQALLDLYETDFELRWLEAAIRLAVKEVDLFEDKENGAFFSTAEGDASLVLRVKEDYDGAEPSGNSMAVLGLLRLAEMTGRSALREAAEGTLRAFATRLKGAPMGVPQMLVALDYAIAKPKQVILAGERDAPDTRAFLTALGKRFLPNRVVLLAEEGQARAKLCDYVPAIAAMNRIDDKATAYVCEDYTCQLPTTSVEKFSELLQ